MIKKSKTYSLWYTTDKYAVGYPIHAVVVAVVAVGIHLKIYDLNAC